MDICASRSARGGEPVSGDAPASVRGYGRFIFDLARAAAALAVLLSHARSFLLLDARDQPSLPLTGQVFYALSGLGHQAVMIFFVVSGCLITRSMMSLDGAGRWSATGFAIPRLTRLWVVLLPCLVVGGVTDYIGWSVGDTLVYAGHYGALRVDGPPVPIALGGTTLLGNLLFVQTILVPPFGSNVPLWSLANEAWYYLGAFFIFSAWRGRRHVLGTAIPIGATASLAFFVLTPDMRALAPVWATGAASAVLLARQEGKAPRHWGFRSAALAALLAALVVARITGRSHQTAADYALGIAVAAVLVLHARWDCGWALFDRAVRFTAGLSYTLYLSHFPLLAFVASVGLHNRRLPYGVAGLGCVCGAVALSLAWAAVLWWAFERHTPTVRCWIMARPRSRSRVDASVPFGAAPRNVGTIAR